MRWTEQSLSSLTTKDGYRLRGESMTRIEVFSDAAFAFAVTMLVISLSTIPQNYQELLTALQRIPSFAASFAVMMLIWITHRRWSERFGLDDGASTFLTLALIFVVLVYVYPLKLIMDLMFYAFSQRWFPADFQVSSTAEVAVLVAIFSVGFFLVALIQFGLYQRAASKADELCLNELEQLLIHKEILVWVVQSILGLLVALIALIFMSSWGYLAGIAYSLTPIIIPLVTLRTRREIQSNLSRSSKENG
ncbi:TMEM175 family protein [Alteromonadaceae bacterium BrNp21-10]|nr:TMEM175 family protein [Alteromonadaceae bacterium BrNp21-10]